MASQYQHKLLWTISTPLAITLPEGISRTFVRDHNGHKLEILYAHPTNDIPRETPLPLFFIHGGFGSAAVWIPWIQYFAERGYACYACSMRGHGASWQPGFWRMFWTPKSRLMNDVRTAWMEARRIEANRLHFPDEKAVVPVLVGHSSGGGLAQSIRSDGVLRAHALVLCAAIPGTGRYDVHA
jgi:pimeloyl-ACP methyl ester carboxylesterase